MSGESWTRVKTLFQTALERPEGERPAFLAAACGTDVGLRAAVERMLAAHARAGAFLETPALAGVDLAPDPSGDEPPPAVIGAYRVVRELGRGGMGTVYLAERDDTDLRRTVAIKVVNVASRSFVRRFRTETAVLAALEHPGIARLYDAGTTERGVPYFVMEYVAGDDLLRYCDGVKATLADRLRLFHRVCDAVQYAHQNFIVHRDLKPSNILVTAEGQPKLLDFGIAKLVSADRDDETAMFPRALTPQYSSPEHVRGDAVTTASDVYSLGIVLYELLTGSRPYHVAARTPAEIERAITGQEPPRPSTVVKTPDTAAARGTTVERLRTRLQGDLDNIVLKALQKDPQQRYATAAEFAEDVQRHLDGYPVHARAATFGYLAARFLRRHRVPVAAAALAAVSLVSGLGAAMWQAHQARLERDHATRRVHDVQRLANALIFKIHDGVANLPNSTPVRRMIVAEALTYLEALRNDPAADESLRIELSQAYQRIGIVQGQGNVANLGDRDGALQSFGKGLDVLRPLMANPAAHPQAAVQFGRTALSMGSTLETAGRTADAEAAMRQADEVASALMNSGHPSEDAMRLSGSVSFSRAILSSPKDAVRYMTRAGEIFERLLAARPNDPDRQRNVALVEKYLGSYDDNNQQYEAALRHHSRAAELDEKRVNANPGNRLALSDYAIDLGNLALAHWRVNRLDEAAAVFERSLAIRQRLADADANDVFARSRVEYVHSQLSRLYGDIGNQPLSLDHARKAVAIAEGLANLDATHEGILADAMITLAEAEARAGDRPEACGHLGRAAAIMREHPSQTLSPDQRRDFQFRQNRLAKGLAACTAPAALGR